MIGQRIAQLRQEQGLSQGEVARRARIAQGYLSNIEAGNRPNPGYDVMKRLARALGVSLTELDPDLTEAAPEPPADALALTG